MVSIFSYDLLEMGINFRSPFTILLKYALIFCFGVIINSLLLDICASLSDFQIWENVCTSLSTVWFFSIKRNSSNMPSVDAGHMIAKGIFPDDQWVCFGFSFNKSLLVSHYYLNEDIVYTRNGDHSSSHLNKQTIMLGYRYTALKIYGHWLNVLLILDSRFFSGQSCVTHYCYQS